MMEENEEKDLFKDDEDIFERSYDELIEGIRFQPNNHTNISGLDNAVMIVLEILDRAGRIKNFKVCLEAFMRDKHGYRRFLSDHQKENYSSLGVYKIIASYVKSYLYGLFFDKNLTGKRDSTYVFIRNVFLKYGLSQTNWAGISEWLINKWELTIQLESMKINYEEQIKKKSGGK